MTAVVERSAAQAPTEPPAHGAHRAHRAEALPRTALDVVALAVVDDAFVHREPGTSIGDHLSGGLVPAAAAVAFAIVYPWLRPGARAIVALTCGSLAVVAGIVDGLRHVVVDRPA